MTPEWAKPAESQLWGVSEALDDARIAISSSLRENNPPGGELKNFMDQFDAAKDELQKLLLDTLSPETAFTDEDEG